LSIGELRYGRTHIGFEYAWQQIPFSERLALPIIPPGDAPEPHSRDAAPRRAAPDLSWG
jgi:hypothetical protein